MLCFVSLQFGSYNKILPTYFRGNGQLCINEATPNDWSQSHTWTHKEQYNHNIWGCMCLTGPFQYRWLKGFIYISCYYHHQIRSIHLSHCYHIFPWLCASDVCYIIFCHLLHIRSGKTGNLFSLLLCRSWWVQIFGYVLACRSYSFVCTVHHLIIIIVQIFLKALNS